MVVETVCVAYVLYTVAKIIHRLPPAVTMLKAPRSWALMPQRATYQTPGGIAVVGQVGPVAQVQVPPVQPEIASDGVRGTRWQVFYNSQPVELA